MTDDDALNAWADFWAALPEWQAACGVSTDADARKRIRIYPVHRPEDLPAQRPFGTLFVGARSGWESEEGMAFRETHGLSMAIFQDYNPVLEADFTRLYGAVFQGLTTMAQQRACQRRLGFQLLRLVRTDIPRPCLPVAQGKEYWAVPAELEIRSFG